jgi:phospholipid-transporting ATPase
MAQRETFEIEQPPVKVQPTYNNAPKKKGLFAPKPRWNDYPDREIIANSPDYGLCDNSISTSRYTALTFLPMNLFQQFSRPANMYFLVIGLLQMINDISISGGEPVIFVPLFFIISVSAIKDLAEDYKRKKSDTAENMKPMKRINGGRIESSKWKNARVGDIIKIQNNEYFPCDLLLVGSSDVKGVGYVETKNLDGETNLKHKVVPKELRKVLDCEEEMINTRVKFIYEKPNPYLYTFTGTLVVGDKMKIPCDNGNFLLRGMSLRNTEWIYGLVAYTGHDTKIMLNSINAKPKKSGLELKMSREIYVIFILQLFLCFGCGIWYSHWTQANMGDLSYLDYAGNWELWTQAIVRAGNWLLMFTNFVPISLIVTLEMVKVLQGITMSQDKNMREPINNIYVTVQSSALNEELGQIDHVFSDKTGTLTCNLMEFKKLCAAGKPFGINRNLDISQYPTVSNVDFQDKAFVDILDDPTHRDHQTIHEYLLFLGLCHTIITQKKGDEIVYNAASPDEFALVNFARFMGYEFRGIDEFNNMVIRIKGKEVKYKLHHVLEFNSTRKRMSVILEDPQGNIKLLCKGADSIILKRMRHDNPHIKPTNDHLEDFANAGLRTLLLAQRTISKEEYKEWTAGYLEASTSISQRDVKIEAAQELIETNLELVGATAIEDKLQDNVGDTIERMKDAGIKVWVLTGDKVETAINIAFSCNLFNNNYYKVIIDGVDEAQVRDQIMKAQEKLSPVIKNALIITGDALIHAMKKPLSAELMKVCDVCESVVCCRVSPKQKAEVVVLVREEKPTATTLAIGDGANDVNMIVAAHVGIGIRGVEGQQAARASDYAIGEFKVLQNLLFVHGRECYRRNSHLILYNFYKNIVLVAPQFWFGFESVFSGQTVYQPLIYQFFNMAFAAFPIIIYSVTDREYSDETLLKHSHFYIEGRNNVHFNTKKYWTWFFFGFMEGLILLVLVDYGMGIGALGDGIGYTSSFWIDGNIVLQVVVFATNLKILVFSSQYSIGLVVSILASIASFFGIYFLFNFWTGTDLYGTFQIYGLSWNSWQITILCICATTMLDLGITRFLELQKEDYRFKKVEATWQRRGTELDISFLDDDFDEKYKGFAFSQEEAADERNKRNYMM